MIANFSFAKWSLIDYHRLINLGILADRRVELINGYIVETFPKTPLNIYYREELAHFLRQNLGHQAWVRESGAITLENSEPEVAISVVVYPPSRYQEHHPYPSEIFWLIEITDAHLDQYLYNKKSIYAQAKIPEYWLIDITSKELYIFRKPENDNYQFHQKLTTGDAFSLSFPDLKIYLDNFWSDHLFLT
ncbi:MAG: Uma2 family endonuclease [Snowella sp.]|jgi:Uma2 family endonuclease|nr:Uma2 family endonuclease [Snowella sp.]